MKNLSVSALSVNQPIGVFYVAVFPSQTLVDITHVDIRTMVDENLDRFMGIQRDFSRKRVEDIKNYVATEDATFPTSVVISVPECCAEWNEVEQKLKFFEYIDSDDPSRSIPMNSIAKIIDGQHRVRGLEDAENLNFQVLVSVFVGADEETEATIFSTVNLAQTKVARSLVYDLYEYSKARSPQKTCHDAAVLLNKEKNSPLYHRIKRLGSSTEGRSELITQATFVNSLLPFVSVDPMKDRDLIRRNKSFSEPKEGDFSGRRMMQRSLKMYGSFLPLFVNVGRKLGIVAKLGQFFRERTVSERSCDTSIRLLRS